MNCPSCNETLLVSERRGVEIDHCPKCRGVWLDRGELDKIIERYDAYSDDNRPVGGRRLDDDDDDDRKYHGKRKSFWRELFD